MIFSLPDTCTVHQLMLMVLENCSTNIDVYILGGKNINDIDHCLYNSSGLCCCVYMAIKIYLGDKAYEVHNSKM